MNRRQVNTSKPAKKRAAVGSAIQYVLPLGNGWVVKSNASATFFAITDSKKEAVTIARGIAKTKHQELIVHKKNGEVETRESYVLKTG